MVIRNIFKYDYSLVLEIAEDVNYIDYILFDTLENVRNSGSYRDLTHSLKLEGPFEIKVINNINFLYIPFEDIEVDLSAFVFTLRSYNEEKDVNEPIFYYDERELFYAETSFLIWCCDTCLDKKNQDKLVALILRKDLLLYAHKIGEIEEAVKYYLDVARLLGLDTKTSSYKSSILPNGISSWKGCGSCYNGSCSIC